MSNQVSGRIISVSPTTQIIAKNGKEPFTKREFLLDATTHDLYTGERSPYDNILPLELNGDKCVELDKFKPGDIVTVYFSLQGREYTTKDGEQKRMISIRCYKVELRAAAPLQSRRPASAATAPVAKGVGAAKPVPPAQDGDDLPF